MKLEPLDLEELELVRKWRNEAMETLRTPFFLTRDMQEDFYYEIVCNRENRHRYMAIVDTDDFIGMGGIINIEWENRLGEISLIINPELRGKGYSEKVVDLILEWAFKNMNLHQVWGEAYYCNPKGISFWEKIVDRYNQRYNQINFKAFKTLLPARKYWNGIYWQSLYFSIIKE